MDRISYATMRAVNVTNCIVITLFFLSSFVLYRSRAGVAGDKLPISHAHGLTMLPSLAVLFLVPQLAFGPKKINKIVFFKKIFQSN